MIALTITPDLDLEPWRDCAAIGPDKFGTIVRIGRLPNGTEAGKSTVAILVTLPGGEQVMAQTPLALFLLAADTLKAADVLEGNV